MAEDLTPAHKEACSNEVVKKILEVKKGKKVAGREEAAKNKEVHKSRTELGLHPATPPTFSDSSLFFNWRAKDKDYRSPIAKQKCVALLNGMFGVNMANWTRGPESWHFQCQTDHI